jgi:hypothetical protein
MATTDPARPKFSNPRLQQVFDEAAPRLEGFQAQLNRISEDIKSLEKYLEASGVRLELSVRFETSETVLDDPPDVTGNYCGAIHQDAAYVEWAPSEPGGRWRVMYKKVRSHGEIDLCEEIIIGGPTFNRDSEVLDLRPLIETPAATRLGAYKALPDLLKKVAETITVQPLEVPR